MIEELRLHNLGVIADATLPIGPGFTAVTGETGAGKTMVVSGLGLLLGQRADAGVVRAGADQAAADGIWVLPPEGAVVDRVHEVGGVVEPLDAQRIELLLGRTVSREGRSRATVGGRSVPAAVLAELGAHLVVVHGQSDQLRLRSGVAQRAALDRFGGEAITSALRVYREQFERWHAAVAAHQELVAERANRAREAEHLRTDLALIEEIDPQPGEDIELAQRAERLGHAEELRIAAASAHEALSSDDDTPDVLTLIAQARRAIDRAPTGDPQLVSLGDQLADVGYRAADLVAALSGYLADLDETGPHELALVEERRAAVNALIRLHGSLDEVQRLRTTGAARLLELDDDDDRIDRLTVERDAAASALDKAAATLTSQRISAAEGLGSAVTDELRQLALPDARVVVDVSEGTAGVDGRDDVTILLAPHPGAEPRPVAKTASGGELSRVMLAIEVVIAATDPVPTFVFDEIDAGIGGAAAIEVGRRLAMLARSAQVIVVTHLAQVAAFAGNHLTVQKHSDGSVTASSIKQLTGADREAEMARLLSGMSDSSAALSHARELLALAHTSH